MPAANYNATVLANGAAGENVMLLTARWDETTPAPACGQFYMLRAWKAEEAPLLSRPISVHRFDREKKEISFLYEVRGTGTQKLAALRPGDTVALTGPSGRGFPVDGTLGGAVALVGGGIGVPPMYSLAKRLLAAGKTPAVILGFNTASEIFYKEEFEALGIETILATADGSVGSKGFVTDALPEAFDTFCACGPMPMLRALCARTKKPGFLSLEARMGCGFGACMGCTIETAHGPKRVCKEGPVFRKEELIW